MSFLGAQHKTIEFGSFAIAYSSPKEMKGIVVTDGEIVRNRHGAFAHSDMVGKAFGKKIASQSGQGFIYVLHPTPELWTLVLPHRTQILYQPDIAFITAMLELEPGVNMIEAGTGSGSFTHSISRSIAPNGTCYTFEYHEERQKMAELEFKEHKLTNVVSAHRNVCKEAFGLVQAVSLILTKGYGCIFRSSISLGMHQPPYFFEFV